MIFNNKFKLLAASLLLLGTASAQAQGMMDESTLNPMKPKVTSPLLVPSAPEVTHDYDWYAAKTYTWTDANGQSYTAKLTDEVTNPYQMYDLLRWVYCNPEIPGTKYSEVTGTDTYYGEQYDVEYTWSGIRHYEVGWDISDEDVTAPYECGHTLFMVKLKNGYDEINTHSRSKADLIEIFSDCIESIQLITDAMRAGEGDAAGTMVNISGTFNRFFILGKGKSYYWEPTTETNKPPYAPFYNMFEEYSPTTTDPGDEVTDFYQKMNAGEVYPVIHDCSTVIGFEHYFSMSGKTGTEEKSLSGMIFFIPDDRNAYNERNYDNQPKVGMYVINLDANAAPAAEELTYDVTLDWTSTLNTVAEDIVPQTYTVYIVTTDEYGNQSYQLLTTTTETTYTYQVPQEAHSYTISYIVYGVATDNNAFNAWSNIDDVVIPGTEDFLSLELDHFESDYRANEELNYYRNFISAENEDALNALTPNRVNNGEDTFTLYRFDTNNPDVMIPVAELKLTAANNYVNYEITYDNQAPLAGYNINIVTSGNLGYYGDDEAINLDAILFVDQFTASTADNMHPNRYGYMLAEVVDGVIAKSTNAVEVPVQKTASVLDGYYTLEEIMADTDRHLDTNIKTANVELNLVNNPAIYYYTVDRGDEVAPNTQISKLQRRTDGTFMEMNDFYGNAGAIYNDGKFDLMDNNVLYGNLGNFTSYVPIIWTFGTDRVNQDGENSYGSPILNTGVAELSDPVAEITYTAGEYVTWKDENNKLCCIYNPVIKVESVLPDYASIDYDVYMYRVWRICDEVRNYTYDPVTGYLMNDVNAPREADKIIVEELTNETQTTFGSRIYDNPMSNHLFGGLSFGAIFRNPATEPANAKYIVRMYYVKKDNAGEEGPMYYVVEKEITANPTVSVNEINVANEGTKIYYNAQGIASDQPFDGMNIVVTRNSDGSTNVTKIIK